MDTFVLILYLYAIAVFCLYALGWTVFRLRRSYLYRALDRATKEIDGAQPTYGMSKGICNTCGEAVTYNKEKKRWKHDNGEDVYHLCHNKGCPDYDKPINGSLGEENICPACGAGFPRVANIVCQGFPILTFWPALWRNLKWKVEGWLDDIDGYYNHQRWGFTIPNATLFLKDFFYNRYHVVKCRELDCRFHEPCDVMPHAMFELLRIYVEQEDTWILKEPEEFVFDDTHYKDWSEEDKKDPLECDRHSHEWRLEVKHLYEWWTKTRIEKQKEYDDLFASWDASGDRNNDPKNRAILEKTWELEEQQNKDLEDAMVRLCKVHAHLWR